METVIYPDNVKSDRAKLEAVYSLIGSQRAEHNIKAVSALADPLKYIKTGKFKNYAEESKRILKKLFVEENRLKEKIRWANYTHDEWKKLAGTDKLIEVHNELFGDRDTLMLQKTDAVSPMLNGFKKISPDNFNRAATTDPTENLSTYTEVDPENEITKTSDVATFNAMDNDSSDTMLYIDKGVNYFDGDFEHLLQFQLTTANFGDHNFWALTNYVEDRQGIRDNNYSQLYFRCRYSPALYVGEIDSGAEYYDGVSISIGTTYFVELERDESIGAYGTAYIYVCTGNYWDEGGTQVGSASVALHSSKKDYRNLFVIQGWNRGGAYSSYYLTGTIGYLDIQAVTANYTPYYYLAANTGV